jgi:xanthine/uracil permease
MGVAMNLEQLVMGVALAVVLEQPIMVVAVVLVVLVGMVLMLLVGMVLEMVDSKAQVLHMPSLLVVKLVMVLWLMMKMTCLLLKRDGRGAPLMCGNTSPRKGW